MMRVLYLARYRNVAMEKKIALMAAGPGWQLWLFRPSAWRDEYGSLKLTVGDNLAYQVISAPLIGRPNDPHRALYRSLTFALRQIKPNLIHAEEEPDSLTGLQIAVARRLFAPRAKLLWHTWQNINRPKSWYVRAIIGFNLRQADAILCANREAVEVLRQMTYTRPAPVIPPQGVDTDIFHPSEPRVPRAPFTIGYVGRYIPEKNIDLLLSAVHTLTSPIRLCLIGNGPQRAQLEEQARSLDAEITFIEPLPLDQLAALYRQLDVLVLPSRATPVWKEQFGRVLIEAMACGVPVVGSDSGAIPEVIGDAGLIFPEGNATALADSLHRLIASPELCIELARRGLVRVQAQYTQERIAQQTLEFYRQCMPA
jgi:glycosyltransferase involved in cell wall biosynthesis